MSKNALPKIICSSLVLLALSALSGEAATIWNGPTTNFAKANGANPTLPANQDRLTSDIWLTRGSSQGLYNASLEGSFSHFNSPSGTEWATGSLANYASLTYHDWNTWAKLVNAGPPSTVGVNAVLHLIPEDIYLTVQFTSWTSSGGGGGFSYIRSTPIVPEPSVAVLLVGGFLLLVARRSFRRFA